MSDPMIYRCNEDELLDKLVAEEESLGMVKRFPPDQEFGYHDDGSPILLGMIRANHKKTR